jgi:hypothetical protein
LDPTSTSSKTPEVVSWLEYYDDIEEAYGAMDLALDVDVQLEVEVPNRSPEAVAAMDPDDGSRDLLLIEEKVSGLQV